MNTLQQKINFLELKVISDKKRLQQSKDAVCERLQQIKKSVSVSQILLGGFAVGFLLGPRRATSFKLPPFTGMLVFYNTLKWLKHSTNLLKTLP